MSAPELQNLKREIDERTSAQMLAAYARLGGFILNPAHRELFERLGIDHTGIIFNEPIPMDFSELEGIWLQQYGRAYRPGKTKMEHVTNTTDEPLEQQVERWKNYDAIEGRLGGGYIGHDWGEAEAEALNERDYYSRHTARQHPKRSPVAKANAKARNRAANKAARKARRK